MKSSPAGIDSSEHRKGVRLSVTRMNFHASSFVDNRSVSAVLGDVRLTDLSPDERTRVWRCFAPICHSRVKIESEKGIDGVVVEGSVNVWNAEEFAPWRFDAPITAVCGDLRFDEETRLDAVVRVGASARVFVRSLYAGQLRVEGELHIIGTLDVSQLDIAPSGFVSGVAG